MILYRPVGLQELELIYDSGMKAFPARLPKQPIFYPVLQLEYARQTASDWNVKNGQYAGYVTEFKVEDKYLARFEKHRVGRTEHEEYWIPAEDLEDFNQHITGHIKVIEAYFGKKFQGFIPDKFSLQGKDAVEQFTLLTNSYVYKRMDFYLEIKRNHKAIFLNYPFWQKHEFKNPGLKAKVVQAIKEGWTTSFPNNPLVTPDPEKVTPPEPGTSEPAANPPATKATPVQPARPLSLGKPGERAVTPPKPIASRPIARPADQGIAPAKPAPSRPVAKPMDPDNTPGTPAAPRSWVRRPEEEQRYPKPINSPSLIPEPDEEADEEILAEVVDEDETFPEPTDPRSALNVDQDPVISARPFPRRSLIDIEEEEDDLDEPGGAPFFHSPNRQDSPIAPQSFTPLEEEPAASEEEDDSEFWTDVAHEEIAAPARNALQADRDDPDEDERDEPEPDESQALPTEIRPVASAQSHWLSHPIHEQPPSSPSGESSFAQGVALGLQGKYPEAIAELMQAVQAAPDDVVAFTSLGVAYHRLGQAERALASYEAALKINPNEAEAHYFRANILYNQGQVREAIAAYTIAIGLEPDLIDAHQQPNPADRLTDYSPAPAEMARIARPARRILTLDQSIKADPRQAGLFKERAAAYYRLWNYEQAVADYSTALALQPDDAAALHLRGVAYEQLGQFEPARQDYQRALALNPQVADDYINRGVELGNRGHFRQSVESLTEGIRLAPRNPEGYFNRGTSFYQLGDLQNAIDDFSVVVQLLPDDEAAYYWRGISYEAAGQREQATADYRQFLALSRDENARAEVEARLKQWNSGLRNLLSRRSQAQEPQPTAPSLPAEPAPQVLDLHDLIVVLGDRALNSTWFGSGVECYGEKARELYTATQNNHPIPGGELLHITSGIRQTVQGDFTVFDPEASMHWLFIHAWDGNGFYLEIDDPKGSQRLKARFRTVEAVEGAPPPFEGLLIRI